MSGCASGSDLPCELDHEVDAGVRDAWPPRTGAAWSELWGLEEVTQVETLLAAQPAIVTITGPAGTASMYANRRIFSEFVLGAFSRWCELLRPWPLDLWAVAILRRVTGMDRPAATPVLQVLRATGLAADGPAGRVVHERAQATWEAALSCTSPANRMAAKYRLARILDVSPRFEVTREQGHPSLDLERGPDLTDRPEGTWEYMIGTLNHNETDVLASRLSGATAARIAHARGVSTSRVLQLEARGLRRLAHPSRSAAFRWRLFRRLVARPSPLVLPPDALTRDVAGALGLSTSPPRMLEYVGRVLRIDIADLDGLLMALCPSRYEAFVPRKDDRGRRPNGFVRCREEPSRAVHGHRYPDVPAPRIGLGLAIQPGGHFLLVGEPETAADQRMQEAFLRDPGEGLLHLATEAAFYEARDSVTFWRELASVYLDVVTKRAADGVVKAIELQPDAEELERLFRLAPTMDGVEHLTTDSLVAMWRATSAALTRELDAHAGDLQACLDRLGGDRRVAGRMHFWLADDNLTDTRPFRFKATYATPAGAAGREVHVPLIEMLGEMAVIGDSDAIQTITSPLAALRASSRRLAELIDSGRVLHDTAWTPEEACDLLTELDAVEHAGIRVHMPAWWNRRPRARARIRFGTKPTTKLGLDVLVDFSVELVLDGEVLDPFEVERILAAARGLMFLRGRWVEVDGECIASALKRWGAAGTCGTIPVREAARVVAGVAAGARGDADREFTWALPETGAWLTRALDALAQPESDPALDAPVDSRLPLRAYQRVGVQWLARLYHLGLGGCLADDMGLGKTLQILALIEWLRHQGDRAPHLVIAPASLLSHWEAQIRHWAPGITVHVAHASWAGETPHGDAWNTNDAAVVLVSLTSVERCRWLERTQWGLIVVDEAQNIKTPTNSSAQAVKRLSGRCRLAVTGTPIENQLSDYWSVFDFINPGLLGSPEDFARFLARDRDDPDPFRALRALTAPYILRRRKSDPSICGELPPKIERQVSCRLTPKQAVLYQKAVDELAGRLEAAEASEFYGLVLPYLHRLKQICNHPSHWLRDGRFAVRDSGKFTCLAGLAHRLAEAGEKALVFTQYRQIAEPLADLLATVYRKRGLVMSSEVSLPERKRYVERFQTSADVPFMVMTLRTGGAGLNLTAATTIVHFDRWWNPAVENQATDRAHRIGQTKSVAVYTFVCRGTLEERIDRLIQEKHALAEDVLATDGKALLTRMTRDELLSVLALDVNAAEDMNEDADVDLFTAVPA